MHSFNVIEGKAMLYSFSLLWFQDSKQFLKIYDFIKHSSGCFRNLLCKFFASQEIGETQIYKFVYIT